MMKITEYKAYAQLHLGLSSNLVNATSSTLVFNRHRVGTIGSSSTTRGGPLVNYVENVHNNVACIYCTFDRPESKSTYV